MATRASGWISSVDYAQCQYVGDRKNQEDSSDIRLSGTARTEILSVLSDGMGGHAAGEVASQLAVSVFFEVYSSLNTKSSEGRLYSALQAVNAEISRSVSADAALRGMGCTLVAIAFGDNGMSWVSVGDSLLFLLRQGRLSRVNEDHSMMPVLEKLVVSGELSKADLSRHPQRNALRSAITGDRLTLIDTSSEPLRLQDGDIVLCASDGLLSLSPNEIIDSILGVKPFSSAVACERLIGAVKAKAVPKQDNVTVQLFHVKRSARDNQRRKIRIGGLLVLSVCLVLAAGLFLAKGLNIPLFGPDASLSHKDAPKEIRPIQLAPELNKKDDPQNRSIAAPMEPAVSQPSKPVGPPVRDSESRKNSKAPNGGVSERNVTSSQEIPRAPRIPPVESLSSSSDARPGAIVSEVPGGPSASADKAKAADNPSILNTPSGSSAASKNGVGLSVGSAAPSNSREQNANPPSPSDSTGRDSRGAP